MIEDVKIPEGTLNMLHEEAWSVFEITLREGKGWPEAFRRAVTHAFSHALEEGIVQMPTTSPVFRTLRRQTPIGRLHDDLAQELDPEHITSPTTWVVLAHEYTTNRTPEAAQELAQKVLEGKR